MSKASRESDVFSFGMVALQIANGRKSISYVAKDFDIMSVDWV